MKATFSDFIKQHPNCKKYESNPEARQIFEDILSVDDNIIAMIDSNTSKKPALSALVNDVETFYTNSPSKLFDLTDDFTKQALGRMVLTILKPFGYLSYKQKDMPKACAAQFVTSAMTYTKDGPATMRVVRKIEEI